MLTVLVVVIILVLCFQWKELSLYLSSRLTVQCSLFTTPPFAVPSEGVLYVEVKESVNRATSVYYEQWKTAHTARVMTKETLRYENKKLISVNVTVDLISMPVNTIDYKSPVFNALLITNYGTVVRDHAEECAITRTLTLLFFIELPVDVKTFSATVQL